MTILVDNAATPHKGKLRFHLASSHSTEQLHEFAARIGVSRCWFHVSRSGVPHYDLNEAQRAAAIAEGAREVTTRRLAELAKRRGP